MVGLKPCFGECLEMRRRGFSCGRSAGVCRFITGRRSSLVVVPASGSTTTDDAIAMHAGDSNDTNPSAVLCAAANMLAPTIMISAVPASATCCALTFVFPSKAGKLKVASLEIRNATAVPNAAPIVQMIIPANDVLDDDDCDAYNNAADAAASATDAIICKIARRPVRSAVLLSAYQGGERLAVDKIKGSNRPGARYCGSIR